MELGISVILLFSQMCKPQTQSEPQRAANRTDYGIFQTGPRWLDESHLPQSPPVFYRKQKPFWICGVSARKQSISKRAFLWQVLSNPVLDDVFPHRSGHWHKTNVGWTWMKNAISYSVCVLYSETLVLLMPFPGLLCVSVLHVYPCVCVYSCWECTQTVLNVFIVTQCG